MSQNKLHLTDMASYRGVKPCKATDNSGTMTSTCERTKSERSGGEESGADARKSRLAVRSDFHFGLTQGVQDDTPLF